MSDFGILLGANKATVGDKMEELYAFEQELAKVSDNGDKVSEV